MPVPGYLQAYVEQGRLGTSAGTRYDSWRDRQGNTQYADWSSRNPRNQPALTPGGENQEVARARQASFHEQQRQNYMNQWGSDQGWNQYAPERGSFRQYARGPERHQARQAARQSYYDQMLGAGPGTPAAQTQQIGGQAAPMAAQNPAITGRMAPVNPATAQNMALPQGEALRMALSGAQMPMQGQMPGQMPGIWGMPDQVDPGNTQWDPNYQSPMAGQGGKGGGQGLPAQSAQPPMWGQSPGGAGGGKGGGQGLPTQQATGRMSY